MRVCAGGNNGGVVWPYSAAAAKNVRIVGSTMHACNCWCAFSHVPFFLFAGDIVVFLLLSTFLSHAACRHARFLCVFFFLPSYLILFIWTCPRSTHNLVLSFQPISQYTFYRARVCVCAVLRSHTYYVVGMTVWLCGMDCIWVCFIRWPFRSEIISIIRHCIVLFVYVLGMSHLHVSGCVCSICRFCVFFLLLAILFHSTQLPH